jgi:hypothetical protein
MSSTVWRSSHHVVSPRRVHARCGAVLSGHVDTVAIHRERTVGRRYTVAACCEWPADRRCLVTVLHTLCLHVLLAFNVLLTACLACALYRSCRVASWKIRKWPDVRSWWQCHRGIIIYFSSPQLPWRQLPPPGSGQLWCRHVSHGPSSWVPARGSLDAATRPVTPAPVSWHRTALESPVSGGIIRCQTRGCAWTYIFPFILT